MISKGKERYIYVYIDFHLFAACSLFHWILLNLTHWTFDPNQPRKTASSVPSVRPKIRWRSSGLCSGIQKMCAVCAAAAAAARACAHFVPRNGMACRREAVQRDQLGCSLISPVHARGRAGVRQRVAGVFSKRKVPLPPRQCSTAAPTRRRARVKVHSTL